MWQEVPGRPAGWEGFVEAEGRIQFLLQKGRVEAKVEKWEEAGQVSVPQSGGCRLYSTDSELEIPAVRSRVRSPGLCPFRLPRNRMPQTV